LPLPEADLAADMYEWAGDFLADAGYVQYEISNWAQNDRSMCGGSTGEDSRPSTPDLQPHYACRHNLQYWRGLPYLGLGAGAHGYADGLRYSNVLGIKTYIERLNPENRPIATPFPLTPATVNQHRNTLREDMDEFMMTGLRLTREGVSADGFAQRFGCDLEDIYGKELERLVDLGLLEWMAPHKVLKRGGSRVRLTPRGRLLGNQVFMSFVG
jgi:oxygen-independent coproporphyrinogen-3 oxidase